MGSVSSKKSADVAEAASRRDTALQMYYPRDPRAIPLADKELERQALNLLLAAPKKEIKKGIKETTRALNCDEVALVVLAADVAPLKLVAHLPTIARGLAVPYIFMKSKHGELSRVLIHFAHCNFLCHYLQNSDASATCRALWTLSECCGRWTRRCVRASTRSALRSLVWTPPRKSWGPERWRTWRACSRSRSVRSWTQGKRLRPLLRWHSSQCLQCAVSCDCSLQPSCKRASHNIARPNISSACFQLIPCASPTTYSFSWSSKCCNRFLSVVVLMHMH